MSIQTEVVYHYNILKITLYNRSTMKQFFNQLSTEFQLEDQNPDNYVLLYSTEIPFNDNPIPMSIANQILFLVAKDDISKFKSFLNLYSPSLVYHSTHFRPISNLIERFVDGRILILNHMKEEIICQVLSFIPFENIENLDEFQKLKEITRWFKEEFFQWPKDIKCRLCNCPTQQFGRTDSMLPNEIIGKAYYAELYKCTKCGAITRFPRYNNVLTLFESRIGRCGEWANAFHAILKALDYNVRYVLDTTDHVWVEVWIEDLQRYVHVDCCENLVDGPLVYETGWGKKLEYVIAFGDYEIVDVTKRYTQKYDEIISRRSLMFSEELVQEYIQMKNTQFLANADNETKEQVIRRQKLDEMSMKAKALTAEEQRARISGA